MGEELEHDPTQLSLDEDEAQHLSSIPKEYRQLLDLTSEGALIVSDMAAEACQDVRVADPHRSILPMLVLKAVEQLRLAVWGIRLGHYSSVPVLLRVALDSIAVLHMVGTSKEQFKTWTFLGYVRGERLEANPKAVEGMSRGLMYRARHSYDKLLSEDPHLRPVSELIRGFNAHVHPDMLGLFERAGVRVSLQEILGDSIRQALETCNGDPVEALKLVELREKYSPGKRMEQHTDIGAKEYGAGLVEEELLHHYSQVVHAAAHHLFDIVDHLLAKYASGPTVKDGKAWHTRSMEGFELFKA